MSFSKLSDNYTPAQNERLIKFLAREKHFAPFSHPHITFRCRAPIFVARQLAKHQVGGTWNEVSRRYVKTTPEYWVPSCLREAAPDVKQGSADTIHNRSSEFLEDWNDICIDAVALYQKMVVRVFVQNKHEPFYPCPPLQNGYGQARCFSGHVFII